jgi:hypothetical protein
MVKGIIASDRMNENTLNIMDINITGVNGPEDIKPQASLP